VTERQGPLLIFAPNYSYAISWATNHGLSPSDWIYPHGHHQVQGRRGGGYVVLGHRYDIELRQYAEICGLTWISAEEFE
jgi:hypothetical protein